MTLIVLTVDSVILRKENDVQKILLIERAGEPFKGKFALPGGIVNRNEHFIDAAKRELFEETNLTGIELIRFDTYGEPGRDPRGRYVTVAFIGHTNQKDVVAGNDAAKAQWFPVDQLPELAFDHENIIKDALSSL